MFRLPLSLLIASLACLASAGCATHADRLRDVRQEYFEGNLDEAAARIDEGLRRAESDADVLRLDLAMVHLASGRPADAERLLRSVRDRFDYLEQADAAEAARSLLTDDQARGYAGEDYEKVLIRAMLALANLMHDGGDAGAYALQMADKQEQIIRRIAADRGGETTVPPGPQPPEFHRVALAPYLRGILREQTHLNYDDVARAYAQVVSWQPGFQAGQEDLRRATYGHHSARGNGVLYAFAFVGRGPYKEEALEVPTTAAMLVADHIISAVGEQTVPPTVAPVKVPRVVVGGSPIDSVRVLVDGQPGGRTETITDVGRFAVEQHRADYTQVLARAVARRAVKKAMVYAAKEASGVAKNSLAGLMWDLGGVAWEATEAADTRCWGLLPDKIQIARIELPAGRHRVTLVPARGAQALGGVNSVDVEVADGRNTYLLASFPDDRLVGQVLTSAGP